MAFELAVYFEHLPEDLKSIWEDEFQKEGFQVKIFPEFDARRWKGGFLPFCVLEAPKKYVGTDIQDPEISGFEVVFKENAAYMRIPDGSSTTHFALHYFAAALLVKITQGRYIDGQNQLNLSAREARDAAIGEIKGYLFTTNNHARIHRSFPGWHALKAGEDSYYEN